MPCQELQHAEAIRRSVYTLDKTLPVDQEKITAMIGHTVLHAPSVFNCQSTRVIVLFGEEHEKLWGLAKEALTSIVACDRFGQKRQQVDKFKKAAATVLFFEDRNAIRDLQTNFPAYADLFPIWSAQTNAMVQYAIWVKLASAGIGANLQHYNPIIDEYVAAEWSIPDSWQLYAQMVFGGIAGLVDDKKLDPLEHRFKVFGSNLKVSETV